MLPCILLNPNLTLRFPLAVHFKRIFGAAPPMSCMLCGAPCIQLVSWGGAATCPGLSAMGCAQILQSERGTNAVRITDKREWPS